MVNECKVVQQVDTSIPYGEDARGPRSRNSPVLSAANSVAVGQSTGVNRGYIQRWNGSASDRRCYGCGGTGHFIRECTIRDRERHCYVCGATTHMAATCTRRFGYGQGENSGARSGNGAVDIGHTNNQNSPLNL